MLVTVVVVGAIAAQRDYPSRTAIANVFHRALGAKNPDPNFRNPDYLAARLLGAPERALLVDHVRAAIDLDYQTAMQRLPPPSPTLVTTHLLRTRHIDLALRNALSADTRQVVILGAGYDTRAYRFHDQLAGLPVFKVDRPATQQYKKLRVREALGEMYKSVPNLDSLQAFTKCLWRSEISSHGLDVCRKSCRIRIAHQRAHAVPLERCCEICGTRKLASPRSPVTA